jgi:uncharacterized membrane protein HdeD (DUF308 family)
MRKLQVKHWQQPVIAGLGAWFAVSPWLLKLQADTPVAATSVILGLALIANAILSIVKQRPVDDWVSASLGLLTAVVPWLAQFASDRVATHNAEAVGLLTLLLALWALAQQGELGNRARAMLVR